jgi:RimK family alpha-L-glutamate ligase
VTLKVIGKAEPVTLFLAGKLTPTNVGLLDAARALDIDAALAPIEDVAQRARPGDVVLPRLDVLPTLDGIEPGLELLERLQRRGVQVLNGGGALLAAHDKLATAIALARAGVAHPRTAHVGRDLDCRLELPVVVKPRFGSWGQDVIRCATSAELTASRTRLAGRQWFARQGALVQELVPPLGYDLRLIVAAGSVVGAVRRVAARGEWRTNIALGGSREPAVPPPAASMLALRAAAAIGADFVGADLLPVETGWIVIELNGCVDFTHEYGFLGDDPFRTVGVALAHLAQRAREQVVSAVLD